MEMHEVNAWSKWLEKHTLLFHKQVITNNLLNLLLMQINHLSLFRYKIMPIYSWSNVRRQQDVSFPRPQMELFLVFLALIM